MPGDPLKTVRRQQKLGLLPTGKSFAAGCERPEPQERRERVFKGSPGIGTSYCIIWDYYCCLIRCHPNYLPSLHRLYQ